MKEMYVKPTMILERFTLSQNIADFCSAHNSDWGHANYADKNSCGWALPDGSNIAWLRDTVACNDPYEESDDINGICYNNPVNGITIFGS